MAEVTHVSITLDAPTLQTLRMGLAQLQTAAQSADALLNEAVQAALGAANQPPTDDGAIVKKKPWVKSSMERLDVDPSQIPPLNGAARP